MTTIRITQLQASIAINQLRAVETDSGVVLGDDAQRICDLSPRDVAQVIVSDPEGGTQIEGVWTAPVDLDLLEEALRLAASDEGYTLPDA